MLAVGLLAAVVIVGNLHDMPQGLAGFLGMRLSVKNALLIGAFAWVWPLVLSACGLYAPHRLRTGQGEWPRLAAAGAVGCVLAMVFPLTSRSGDVTPLHALLFGVAIVPAAGLFRASVRAVERKRQQRAAAPGSAGGQRPSRGASCTGSSCRIRTRSTTSSASWTRRRTPHLRETGWRTWAGSRTSSRY